MMIPKDSAYFLYITLEIKIKISLSMLIFLQGFLVHRKNVDYKYSHEELSAPYM